MNQREMNAIMLMAFGIFVMFIGLHVIQYYPRFYGAFGLFIFLLGLTYMLTGTLKEKFGEKFYYIVIIVWIYGLVLAFALLDALGIFPYALEILRK